MKISYFLYKFSIFCFISFIVILFGLYLNAFLSPTIDLKKTGKLIIYDDQENLIYQGSSSSKWIDLKDINKDLVNSVISVEDKSFYQHHGFDYVRIASALFKNITSGSIVEGASTITQQYAKNMYLDFDKTLERKIEEFFITLELEVHYDKNEILEGYLNTIYYGHGCYGIESASKYYFNKSASDVSLEESLILAGIPKSPNLYNPLTDLKASINRAKTVALTMLNNNYISQDEYDKLNFDNIKVYGQDNVENLKMLMYYQDAVLQELNSIEEIPTSLIESGGIKIYTNLNMETQTNLEKNILEYKPDDEVQVASVIGDPKTGKILALTGGTDYSKSTFNRAISSKRQVGSTMKPFLYYAALENNLTSSSTFKSEATTFNLSNNLVYSPSNYSKTYANKKITMASAIAMSDNIYAVKTNLFLGVDKMIDVAKTTGIKGNLEEVTSLALGTSELNIIDLTTGYSTFASNGYLHDLHFINRVETLDGTILYEKKIDNDLVLNQNYVYILNDMLAGTYDDVFIDYTSATGLSIANKLNNTYAFKSGTTDTDSWSIGYNNDLIMSVWMGYDENKNTNTKTSLATKNIWADTIEQYFINKKTSWYEQPQNVVALMLDAITGKQTEDPDKATIFYYVTGSEPTFEMYVSQNE